ncbi:hypothetical protein ACIPY3_09400 [Paenarthrobacter sp. NPDC089714]|uniref:hypothetical protein n=1 Tax=Paenarthrobacter sp. NPDC089714 TaxID=3364377 RepID=UPI0037F56B4E
MPERAAKSYFDPKLDDIDLDFLLGGRPARPAEIAGRILSTLSALEHLDARPIEWVDVLYPGRSAATKEAIPRSVHEMELRVGDGARKDDAGNFYPSWGYYLSVLGFLAGSDRSLCPFSFSVSDGEDQPGSRNSFELELNEALVSGREAITECVASLVDIWSPIRGGVFGYEVTKQSENHPLWYPPVGVLTYMANGSGYTLPPSPLVDLRPLQNGTLAVLKDWTLDAVLAYQREFRAVTAGARKAPN